MSESLVAGKSERLLSLDVFRGITIAGMVMVNNPGSWGHMYGPLGHAQWHGWTPTDFIFPFFLFMVGVSMTFSFDKRLKRGDSKLRLFEQVIRRTLILFFLGLILTGFPDFRLIMPYILGIAGLGFLFADEPPLGKPQTSRGMINKAIALGCFVAAIAWFIKDFGYFNSPAPEDSFWWKAEKMIRIPGVLQRIALCYFFTAIIVFYTGWKGRLAWAAGLCVAYYLILTFIHPPGSYTGLPSEEPGNILGKGLEAPVDAMYRGGLVDWIDMKLLGGHLYSFRPDPEGLLSTIPAIATTLTGVLCGSWLKLDKSKMEKAAGMLAMGFLLYIVGSWMDYFFPINKKIWTSSYVIFITGMALLSFGLCYWSIDILGIKKWTPPFTIFGTNAILIFFGSGIMVRLMYLIRFPRTAEGEIDYSGFSFSNMWNQIPPDGETATRFATLKDVIHEDLIRDPLRWFFEMIGLSNPESSLYFDYYSFLTIDKTASMLYALFFIILWLVLTIPLYRNKIYLKV